MLELVYKYLDTWVDTMYNAVMSMNFNTNPQADFQMLMQIEERAANGLFDCCEDCLNTCIVYKAKDASLDCRMFNPRGGK